MPILHAPILEQAGFVESALPIINYVARLDGATQNWQLTAPISLIAGDKVRLKYQAGTTASTSIKTLYGRDVNFYFLTALGNDGAYAINAGAIKVDGVDYVAGNQAPIDGGIHTVEQSISASVSTSIIGAAWGSFSEKTTIWHFDSVLFDFEVERGGEIIHAIPLTNKSQGATQLATVGSVNATMVDYTPDVWELLDNRDEYERSTNNYVEDGYVEDYFE